MHPQRNVPRRRRATGLERRLPHRVYRLLSQHGQGPARYRAHRPAETAAHQGPLAPQTHLQHLQHPTHIQTRRQALRRLRAQDVQGRVRVLQIRPLGRRLRPPDDGDAGAAGAGGSGVR